MAILNNSNAISSGGYDINNSLRFRSSASAYLNRTPASAGNRQKFTLSFWAKRGSLGSPQTILSGGATGGTGTAQFIGFDTDNTFFFSNFGVGNVQTTQVFRDPSAWYHIVVAIDTTQATAANRVIFYVNGIQVTSYSATTYPAQNTNLYINTNEIQTIGRASYSALYYNDGYLTEYNFIDGSALTPSSFGETDTTTGVWKPKAYTSTYGTNGFYLKFSDIATTSGSNAGLGKDFSGNTNYWTTNNISVTAGTTYDAMIDSPTLTSATVANYAVLNPLDLNGGFTFADANLKITATSSARTRATFGVISGKWYWEIIVNDIANGGQIGVLSSSAILSGYTDLGTQSFGWGLFTTPDSRSGQKQNNNTTSNYGGTVTTGDVVMCALDMDTGSIYWGKNGQWANGSGSWNQSTPNNAAFTNLSGFTVSPAFAQGGSTSISWSANFGQRPFSYTPPTGYVRLNTYNLPDSTIKKGNTVMDATLYTGTNANQTVVNAGAFKPDFVWVKSRSVGGNPVLVDSVRGATKVLYSPQTTAEETPTAGTAILSLNSNGFSLGTDISGTSWGSTNGNTFTYVGWQWQAGQGSTSSNTSGSITSTVSVNTTAGFSVVTYTGAGTSAGTVGHGLGVAPKLIIAKTRGNAQDWVVYHSVLGTNQLLILNSTSAASTISNYWGSSAPTSTVFGVYTANNIGNNNYLDIPIVAYCWAEIAGFSKFGSYTGNGSTDGPFVFTNFRPKYILIKNSSNISNWVIFDTSRSPYNNFSADIYANISDAEYSGGINPDILSNGFKIRTSNSTWNGSGNTFIYMAFAENPFKNANAR